MTKANFEFFPAETNVPVGKTYADPVVGAVLDARNSRGGELYFRITNNGAITAACTIMFQISAVGGTNAADWFDFWPVTSKDLLTGTVTNGPSIPIGKGPLYIRAIAYGNVNNTCKVQAGIQHDLVV